MSVPQQIYSCSDPFMACTTSIQPQVSTNSFMAYKPRFSHIFKVLFGRKDVAAAEGLFMEGQIEFESGNQDEALLMFYFGKRLNPAFAGNFYNYAVALEKTKAPTPKALAAWKDYLRVADQDIKQTAETKARVKKHVEELEKALGK